MCFVVFAMRSLCVQFSRICFAKCLLSFCVQLYKLPFFQQKVQKLRNPIPKTKSIPGKMYLIPKADWKVQSIIQKVGNEEIFIGITYSILSCLSKTPNFPSFCTGRNHSLESCFFCSQVNQLTNFSSLLLCCRRIFFAMS